MRNANVFDRRTAPKACAVTIFANLMWLGCGGGPLDPASGAADQADMLTSAPSALGPVGGNGASNRMPEADSHPPTSALDPSMELVVNGWALSASDCGVNPGPQPSPSEIMAGVPEADRVALIERALREVPMDPARMGTLMELLGGTRDVRAIQVLFAGWDATEERLDRYWSEVYEPSIAQSVLEPGFRVPEARRQNMLTRVRESVLRAAGQFSDAAALALLERGLDDIDPFVRSLAKAQLQARGESAASVGPVVEPAGTVGKGLDTRTPKAGP